MTALGHLARRFVGSLRPGGPSAAVREWVGEQLLPAEQALWRAMPGPDRRHSAAVARRVQVELGDAVPREVLAAALLHDVGKASVGLRTPGRVVATVTAMVVGHDRAAGFDSAIGRYLRHDAGGAALLEEVGSAPLTVAWTREHHLPRERWTVPQPYADALHAADDD